MELGGKKHYAFFFRTTETNILSRKLTFQSLLTHLIGTISSQTNVWAIYQTHMAHLPKMAKNTFLLHMLTSDGKREVLLLNSASLNVNYSTFIWCSRNHECAKYCNGSKGESKDGGRGRKEGTGISPFNIFCPKITEYVRAEHFPPQRQFLDLMHSVKYRKSN